MTTQNSEGATGDTMELEKSTGFEPTIDRRPRMPEPLPVRLVAVADVAMPAPAGAEQELDAFYVGLLGFERDRSEPAPAYLAENFRLRFEVREGLVERQGLRSQLIEVPSLAEMEMKLIEAEIEYIRQKGLTPGQEALLLLDPAGNWVELVEMKRIR